jgi:hypothetical protein
MAELTKDCDLDEAEDGFEEQKESGTRQANRVKEYGEPLAEIRKHEVSGLGQG